MALKSPTEHVKIHGATPSQHGRDLHFRAHNPFGDAPADPDKKADKKKADK